MYYIQEQKSQLRKEIQQQRSKLSLKIYQEKNVKIHRYVLPFVKKQNAQVIHCFISMNSRFEVDTHQIIQELLDQKKTVIVPVMNSEMLEHSILDSLDELSKRSWGVIEPNVKIEADIQTIDIVLVPLLGVDIRGNRLGYGKGYYDRFLERTNALKIGLAFDEFVFQHIPVEDHDIKLDGIITEKGVRLL